jgi:hypothetical protein
LGFQSSEQLETSDVDSKGNVTAYYTYYWRQLLLTGFSRPLYLYTK